MSSKLKPKIEYQRVDVGGTCVNFPFTPYDIQVDYMKKVLECLDNSHHGLLESPTGTGKTLSSLSGLRVDGFCSIFLLPPPSLSPPHNSQLIY